MSRSQTLKKKKEEKKAAADSSKGAGGEGDGQKTVFISCSTLIKEVTRRADHVPMRHCRLLHEPLTLICPFNSQVKLCVGNERHAALDGLYDKLTNHQIPAEQAVRLLMEMVGSTIVQQAGLSVMNAQKGVLPHGWLEYTDEASGRSYFYNVHTKVTTWYKPTGAVPPPPPASTGSGEEMMINMDCTMESHNVAMSGFI